ncbi:MAG: 2Fe-2S iron-sulfur cluster-binding protein [Rhizobiaceae bacterium]
MAAPRFHDLTITAIRPQTADGVALTFGVPDKLAEEFEFIPGQYLTLRAIVGGEDIRRAYSICSADDAAGLEVGIKRVEGGAFSNFAAELNVGDSIQIMTPQGQFTAEIGGAHNYLLLASGSGITPCLSIAKSVLAHEPESTITLIYGNTRTQTMMFREDINALKDRYTERLQVVHVLSREQQGVDFLNGRLNGEMVKALNDRGLISPSDYDAAYLCGPQEMIEEATASLKELGMKTDAIKFELFTSEGAPQPVVRRSTTPGNGTAVTIIIDGVEKQITVDGSAETVLVAAQRQGLDLPFSCAGGMCCTCRCKVVEGESEMDVSYSLQEWEIEQGFTLACQTRPKGTSVTLDFDES